MTGQLERTLSFDEWYAKAYAEPDGTLDHLPEGHHAICQAAWQAAVQSVADASLAAVAADRDRLIAHLEEIKETGTRTTVRLYGDMYAGEYEDITEVSDEAEIAERALAETRGENHGE